MGFEAFGGSSRPFRTLPETRAQQVLSDTIATQLYVRPSNRIRVAGSGLPPPMRTLSI